MSENFLSALRGRPNTIKTQASLYRNHIHPHLHMDLEALVDRWIEDELKPGTINKLISLYRKYTRWATGKDIETRELVSRVSRMEQEKPVKAWTREESQRALREAQRYNSRFYKMLLLTLHTGVRKGEMLGLRWGDVDFFQCTILIQRSYDGPTKSGKSRQIPMSDVLDEELRIDYVIGEEDEQIFPYTGDPNKELAIICQRAEVPHRTWHDLRHTFATLALDAGLSPKDVADMLGHASVKTTLDTYWQSIKKDIDLSFVP